MCRQRHRADRERSGQQGHRQYFREHTPVIRADSTGKTGEIQAVSWPSRSHERRNNKRNTVDSQPVCVFTSAESPMKAYESYRGLPMVAGVCTFEEARVLTIRRAVRHTPQALPLRLQAVARNPARPADICRFTNSDAFSLPRISAPNTSPRCALVWGNARAATGLEAIPTLPSRSLRRDSRAPTTENCCWGFREGTAG